MHVVRDLLLSQGCGLLPQSELQRTRVHEVRLSRSGTVWSYSDARWQPPLPYISTEPFQPFAIAAVSLARENLVVLGQVATGYGVDDLEIGCPVQLVLEPCRLSTASTS